MSLENIKFVVEYLKHHPCVDCGESDPIVLDFDHIAEKKLDVSRMIFSQNGIAAIKTEIAKCEVRCANCHRRITALRSQTLRYKICNNIPVV